MNEQYPTNITLEIERERLRNYLRAQALILWSMLFVFFGLITGFCWFMERVQKSRVIRADLLPLAAEYLATSVSISFLLALLVYILTAHRGSARFAATLQVVVEGCFLRVINHRAELLDRKIHFRSIVDYTVTQDSLMRYFGIYNLQMSTTAGGRCLSIPGVKDCLRARDLLAEIDRLREQE